MATGVSLLVAGKGQKLFVSGVHPGHNVRSVLNGLNVSDDLRDCCIILGHTADNTVGNAEETAAWLQAEDFRSIRLVTANYHMPRSLLLFRDTLPETEIVPHPVAPDSVKLAEWWAWPGTSSLLVTEYNKYIVAALHIQLRDWLDELEDYQ